MRLAHLRRLTLEELRCRGRQGAHKLVDRVAPKLGPGHLFSVSRRSALQRASEDEAALAQFLETAPRRFFPGATRTSTAAVVNDRFPEVRRAILQAARQVVRGRFDLLGYRGLEFGDPLDWQYDPISNRHAPARHWSRLDPLDVATVGDSKVVWELNRHQWLVTLGQAFQLTGDPAFAESAFARIDDWMDRNPYGVGINWASSLEVAFRLISWCWTLMLFSRASALTPARFRRVHASARTHAAHIERYLSYYYSPNTHLTGEALGLFYAGVLFAHQADAARWRDLGRDILIDQLERQVASDGVYFEQATCYHRYTLEIYLHFIALASQNHIPLPSGVSANVRHMAEWLVGVCHPDRSMPAIGDADGGWVMPLVQRAPDDCRGLLAVAAVMFDRGDLAWGAGGPEPELLWMEGREGARRFSLLPQQPPATAPSQAFPSGYAVMRDRWHPDAHQLLMDVGPLGCPFNSAHGHADLLSIQCSAFGENYLVDPGTYCYTLDAAWRNHFRGTAAHSTVVIDAHDQADTGGPFSWRQRPVARIRAWESAATHDFIDAEHDGYARLRAPVIHRRRVLFVKPQGWVVIDDLIGRGTHLIELRFQFSPRRVAIGPGLWTSATGRRGRGLWLTPVQAHDLTVTVREGQLAPAEGWISPAYGVRQPAPMVVYATTATVPFRVITLIVPVDVLTAAPPTLDVLEDVNSNSVAFRFPGDDRIVRLAADLLALERGQSWSQSA